MRGTVKWFNDAKGYGFIAPKDGSVDVFVHFSAMTGSGFRTLDAGDLVEYDAYQGKRGLAATNVQKLGGAK